MLLWALVESRAIRFRPGEVAGTWHSPGTEVIVESNDCLHSVARGNELEVLRPF